MSSIPNGGSNIFIASGQTSGGWGITWNNGGWQGNTFIEAQPLNTGASLSTSLGSSSLNNNGTYSFGFSLTNHGPNSTFCNLQVSNN
jgi:hypothetical protein